MLLAQAQQFDHWSTIPIPTLIFGRVFNRYLLFINLLQIPSHLNDCPRIAMSVYAPQENQNLSEEEYLRTEELSEVRREYINGQLFPKNGESFNHNFIVGNIGCNFSLHLKDSPCNTYMLAMLLRLEKDFVYPDVMVDCKTMKGDDNVASSPIILVEVLSKTTRKTDCTVKLQSYMKLPLVQEYVIIEQDIVSILVLRRRNHWLPEYFFLGDLVNFESIGLVLPVEEIYYRVDNAEMLEFRLLTPV